jgi:hypothetical protein
MELPTTSLDRALQRQDTVWHTGPGGSPHVIVVGQSGSGKSHLIREMLTLCDHERVLILDAKPAEDPIWQGPPDDPWKYGRPVEHLPERFGYSERGGGPLGMFWRLTGSPDRGDTAKRFSRALSIVAAEGHTVLVCEDVVILSRQLKLAEQVDEILHTARSASVMAVLSATALSYVAGRSQSSQVWVGYTGGSIPAAKAAADLIGWRGRDAVDYLASIKRHQFLYHETEEGSAGPVLVS